MLLRLRSPLYSWTPLPRRRSPSPRKILASEKEKGRVMEDPLDPQAEVVWHRLIAAGLHIPPESEFLKDPVAQVVIMGLLDKIVMLQQHNNNTIKTFATVLKQRATTPEGQTEAKCLRPQESRRRHTKRQETLEALVAPLDHREAGKLTPPLPEQEEDEMAVDKEDWGLTSSMHTPSSLVEILSQLRGALQVSAMMFHTGVPKRAG